MNITIIEGQLGLLHIPFLQVIKVVFESSEWEVFFQCNEWVILLGFDDSVNFLDEFAVTETRGDIILVFDLFLLLVL